MLFAEGTSSDGNGVVPFKTPLFAAAKPSGGTTLGADICAQTLALTYTKLRFIAGSARLAERAVAAVEQGSARFAGDPTFSAAVREMRGKLEKAESSEPGSFKTGPGGFYDIDFVASYLMVRHGVRLQFAEGRRGKPRPHQGGGKPPYSKMGGAALGWKCSIVTPRCGVRCANRDIGVPRRGTWCDGLRARLAGAFARDCVVRIALACFRLSPL